jgi:hypothetical protein
MQRIRQKLIFGGTVAVVVLGTLIPTYVFAMPEFSREYRTPCNTCHIGFPKLNDLGRAFKDAGFRFPEKDLPLVEEPAVLLTSGASDPQAQTLNNQFATRLNCLLGQVQTQHFPYRFRLSRTAKAEQQPQKYGGYPIRFGKLDDKVTLDITGKYYVAYSYPRMNIRQRMSQTFRDVVLPMLRLAIEQFRDNEHVQAYAFEISEHVRGTVLGVPVEAAEDVAWILPRDLANKLIAANSEREQQALMGAAQLFLNAVPIRVSPVP